MRSLSAALARALAIAAAREEPIRAGRSPGIEGTKTMTKTMRKASSLQIFKIGKRLEEVYDKEAGIYKAGYTDNSVASELDVGPASVEHLRIQMFGKFHRRPADDDVNKSLRAMDERLRALEDKLADLQRAIDALTGGRRAAA